MTVSDFEKEQEKQDDRLIELRKQAIIKLLSMDSNEIVNFSSDEMDRYVHRILELAQVIYFIQTDIDCASKQEEITDSELNLDYENESYMVSKTCLEQTSYGLIANQIFVEELELN